MKEERSEKKRKGKERKGKEGSRERCSYDRAHLTTSVARQQLASQNSN
jgi:hypothetical protein